MRGGSFHLPAQISNELRALSRREGVTLYMTLLAAWQTLLHRYTGQNEIVVGTDIANRNRSEIESLIGFFTNQLVLRADFSGNPTFKELLRRVREVTLGAYAHQDLPFEKLVEVLQLERMLDRNPLFQVMFVFQNTPMQDLELPGLSMRTLEIDEGTTAFDLTLTMEETDEGIRGSMRYSTDLFNGDNDRADDEALQKLCAASSLLSKHLCRRWKCTTLMSGTANSVRKNARRRD